VLGEAKDCQNAHLFGSLAAFERLPWIDGKFMAARSIPDANSIEPGGVKAATLPNSDDRDAVDLHAGTIDT
jgi:hypothetical protein